MREGRGVRLQNLRECTVQIRHTTDPDAIVGTGVAVSTLGQVVTCAHVVEDALGVHPRDAGGAEVGVYFPQARGGEEEARRATVAGCFPQHDDDVVLLQLTGGPSPLAPEQIAVLGRAGESRFHPFRSYGYRRLEKYVAGHAHGTIPDFVKAPAGHDVQAEPVQLESQQINRGMSGAAVLDIERNLVVGLVSETWFPDLSTKDRDTAWAVDARVLTFDPLNLPLRDDPLPKRQAPQPRTDVTAARRAAAPHGIAWNGAPPPLREWVGRDDLLKAITRDWDDPEKRVTGLIGFGGEGKSSLARRWVDMLDKLPTCPTPDGIFWWAFYDRPSVDEFFEAALNYMGGGKIDPRRVPSASIRAQIIGAMLGAGRYLFVLDGLEVLQHQEGDGYGLLCSADLRDFLALLAAPGHDSFCLVTSRAPLLDLMAYTTYTHRDIMRLSDADGRALLRKVGVVGQDVILSNIVSDWDGHALTLGLIGAYLADKHDGDVSKVSEIPPPTADEPRYQRVHRVLRRYDEHLTDAERDFLTLFSAFRTPVHVSAFDKVFGTQTSPPWGGLRGGTRALAQCLLTYRLLRHNPHDDTYTAHPLIRNHYFARLTARGPSTSRRGEPVEPSRQATAQDAHARIKDYYLELAGDTPRFPTLDDLAPLIEVVHHACRAGAYDEAINIYLGRISQRNRFVILYQLGAYETALSLLLEFFPGDDLAREPLVSKPRYKGLIFATIGLCLMNLGRLREAVPFYERGNAIDLGEEDWNNVSRNYGNLAELHAHLGALAASADAARQALALARRAENKREERDSLACQAWAAHLRGPSATDGTSASGQALERAGAAFRQAEALAREIDPDKRYLYSLRGIWHADHLRRVPIEEGGDPAYARRVTEANLEICERNRWADHISQCHRVLGDLDADPLASSGRGEGQHVSARAHYDQALKIARAITHRPALIEALLARGRWAARRAYQTLEVFQTSEVSAAFSDLNEALGYAVEGGYRVYEADIRVALAWAHLAAGEKVRARQKALRAQDEAQRAQQMSVEMGYHWGQVDAAEVLEALACGGGCRKDK
jgi:tetratricopeptide (TPR) repeat protein